jgi:hypothetical protein
MLRWGFRSWHVAHSRMTSGFGPTAGRQATILRRWLRGRTGDYPRFAMTEPALDPDFVTLKPGYLAQCATEGALLQDFNVIFSGERLYLGLIAIV